MGGKAVGSRQDTLNDTTEDLKLEAAWHAVKFVQPGMVLGLGAGSTAAFAMRRIAQLLHEGQLKDVLGIPCSHTVEAVARALRIPLTTLEDHPVIDLTIDGADEVDPNLDLIKGGGGALLREKIVAQASHREVIVIAESKLSPQLGTRSPVPVEVVPFGWRSHRDFLESLGAEVLLRTAPDGAPFQTDQGNYVLDCRFRPISEPSRLAVELSQRAGIVEHGLFLGLATDVVVAGQGGLSHLKRGEPYDRY
ncbi:MAG TPA: ribose-5-phosphate isomerase RpiA [Chloroflexi bacterium]|nr:ribose-5-phosphate isomerase RpiA [Chloroflexota bacterium]